MPVIALYLARAIAELDAERERLKAEVDRVEQALAILCRQQAALTPRN